MIRFRRPRRHYLDNVLLQVILHALVAGGLYGCGFLALKLASWWPIFAWFFLAAILHLLAWYDEDYGWPIRTDTKNEQAGDAKP